MRNLIHSNAATDRAELSVEGGDSRSPLYLFGTAVCHRVALSRVEGNDSEKKLHVVIGLEDREAVEIIAVLPDTPDGEKEARRIAYAVLHSLNFVNKTLIDRIIESLD